MHRSPFSRRTPRFLMTTALALGLLCGCPAAARGPDIGRLPVLTSDDPKAEADLRDADHLAAAGKPAEARNRYEAFLRDRPADRLVPVAQLALGRLLLSQGDTQQAAGLFASVARHREPAVAEQGRFYAGLADERLGRHADAIAALEPMRGRTIEPADTALLLHTLADAYEHEGRVADAILTLQSALEDNVPEAERKRARSRIAQLASGKASPADLRRLRDELTPQAYAWREVTVRALLDADAARDAERARELLEDLKDEGVPFDDQLNAIAVRAERPSDANPAVIGAILPLSGRARKVGELSLRGLMVAAGLPPKGPAAPDAPQLIFRDDGGDAATAIEAVNELVSVHRAIAIIGPVDAQVALAAGKRAQELGVPMIALTPAGEPTSAGPLVFRYFPTPHAETLGLVQAAHARGARRFALLGPQNAYGDLMAQTLEQAVAAVGGEIIARETYAPGATSFGIHASRLAKAGPDALLVADTAQTLALIAPALAAAGLWSAGTHQKPPSGARAVQVLAPSLAFDATLPQLSGRYLQGALFAVPFDASSAAGPSHDFVVSFQGQFGGPPDAFAAHAHDAYVLLRAAISGGASSRAAVAAALPETRTKALVAPARGFGARREPEHPVQIFELAASGFSPVSEQ
jgi:branched-chain amino acid transport system substrate-binding protein